MASKGNTPDLGNFDFGICKKKARQIIGRAGFRRQDREDIEQELLCRVVQALKSFDPSRGDHKSYITAVVERAFANLHRDAMAQKRDPRRISSLQVIIDMTDDCPVELAETISDREYNARRCRDPRSPQDLAQLVTDLAELAAVLPADVQQLIELLKATSVAAASRELGVPRTTLVAKVRRLKENFKNLRDYLK